MKSTGFDYPLKEKNIYSLPTRFKKSTEKNLLIKTGLPQLKNIGLHVNTNLHVQERIRFHMRDIALVLLFCFLTIYLVLTNFETQQLRFELEETRKYAYMLGESLDTITDLYKGLQEEMKLRESLLQEKILKENSHSMKKREVDNSMTNCTSSRENRSISRGKHSHSKNRNGNRRGCPQTSDYRVKKTMAFRMLQIIITILRMFSAFTSVKEFILKHFDYFTHCGLIGPHAVHLRGSFPEISVRDGGLIAPWYVDKSYSDKLLLAEGIRGEGSGILEIVEEGLYFIYAQIYYLTSSSLNSYTIKAHLHNGSSREDLSLAVCSTEATTKKLSELSCYTAVVRYLRKGDRVYLSQRERNLRILFRDNKSFLGFVLLNSRPGGEN